MVAVNTGCTASVLVLSGVKPERKIMNLFVLIVVNWRAERAYLVVQRENFSIYICRVCHQSTLYEHAQKQECARKLVVARSIRRPRYLFVDGWPLCRHFGVRPNIYSRVLCVVRSSSLVAEQWWSGTVGSRHSPLWSQRKREFGCFHVHYFVYTTWVYIPSLVAIA